MLALIVQSVTTLVTFASLFYFMTALWGARSFVRRRRGTHPDFAPGVSILKPLKGLDPGMYEAFASHCRQEYAGEYELLFGVSSLDDPAVEAVDRLHDEFPNRHIRLVLCPEKLGLNGKVSNLAQMVEKARYDYLVVNDSDIQVSSHYLRNIMSGFAEMERHRRVGMVTAPYRGITHKTIGSKLEALGIATDFFPGVFTALLMDGRIRFGLGSTLAMTREALAAAGGFEAVVDSLADDYELGERIASAGFAVILSRQVVSTWIPPYRIRDFFAHQLRWARTVRDSRKAGYVGLIFTFGLPWAVLNTVTSGFSMASLALLSLTFMARITVALTVGVGLLNDRQVLRDLWLLPLRDVCAFGIWIWSFASNSITWRGERFLLRHGKLVRPSNAESVSKNPVSQKSAS